MVAIVSHGGTPRQLSRTHTLREMEVMRLHTDKITESDIHAATRGLPGVYAEVSTHGSRSKTRAFEVSLEGNGYRKNSGKRGTGDECAATWDEWGVVIARLFEIDPAAFWGTASCKVYADACDFHEQTIDRFEDITGLPADTHRRHNWQGLACCTSTPNGARATTSHKRSRTMASRNVRRDRTTSDPYSDWGIFRLFG